MTSHRLGPWWNVVRYRIRDAAMNVARQGFEAFLLLLCLMSGARGLWNPEGIVSAVHPLLPEWGRIVWYAGLFSGAVIALVGIAWTWPWGSRVEKAGLIVLTGAGLAYTFLAITFGAVADGVLVAVFVLVVVTRIWLIWREPRDLAAAVRLIQNADGDT